MKKAVFVDMGETLVKFIPRYDEAVTKAIREIGIEVNEKDVFRALMAQMGENHFPHKELGGLSHIDFKDLFYRLGKYVPSDIIKELSSRSYLSERYELYDDAIPFLEEIKGLGLKVILVSNATKKIHDIVKELGLLKYLDGIAASCDLGIMKPHPKIFYYAKKIGGTEGIHIGDVYEIDYLGAKRAYLDGILLDRFNFYPEIKDNKARNLLEVIDIIKARISD